MSKIIDWTIEEDIYLNQGVANFGTDFKKIRDSFPFKSTHDQMHLQERWHEIDELCSPADQEIKDKIKASVNRYKHPSFNYSAEYKEPEPNLSEFEEIYTQMPSLTAAALQPDMETKEQEIRNINALSLNSYFTAESIVSIVNDALNKTIDDEHLRNELIKDFHTKIIDKVRRISMKTMTENLVKINAMPQAEQERECRIFEEKMHKILLVIQFKFKMNPNIPSSKNEYVQAFTMINYISVLLIWPQNPSAQILALKENIYTKLAQLCAYFFNFFITDPSKIPPNRKLIEIACKIDLFNKIDTFLIQPYMKQEVSNMKMVLAQQQVQQNQTIIL